MYVCVSVSIWSWRPNADVRHSSWPASDLSFGDRASHWTLSSLVGSSIARKSQGSSCLHLLVLGLQHHWTRLLCGCRGSNRSHAHTCDCLKMNGHHRFLCLNAWPSAGGMFGKNQELGHGGWALRLQKTQVISLPFFLPPQDVRPWGRGQGICGRVWREKRKGEIM